MTALDVGSLVGRVVLETTTFDRAYARVVQQFSQLGAEASKGAAGTAKLDESFVAVGGSADKAAAGMTRASRAAAGSASAEEKAARVAAQHASAVERVGEVMSVVTTDAQRYQQMQLRLIAAQERYDAVMASGTASTRTLAAAQSGLIGAQRALQRAEEQSAGRMSTLTGSMDAQAASLARVEALMAGMTGATEAQQAAALRELAAQERLNGVLASSTATTRELAAAQAGLIAAQRGVAASQDVAAASSRRFGGAMGGTLKMARDLGLLFGAFEAVKQVISITKEANDFQRSMVQVQTNADVTATEVNKASSALLDMAGPVAAAPAELAVAWYHAKSVGLDYAKSIEVTRIAAEGARVGHADLEETMNALTSTVASGIPGVQDMSSAMGQLITIVGSGDMKLADLNDALGTGVLVRMKQYGLSLTDVGAALATFGDNNIRGADAATLLRMSVEAMAKQGKPGEAALKSIGIEANQLRDDMQHGGLNKAVLDLNSHLKAAGITGNQVGGFLIDAFTKKGGGGVAVLLGQIDRLESKFKILRTAGASFGDKWQATTQTASFALASLGHGAEAAGIKLTEKLGPSIAAVARWFGEELPQAAHAAAAVFGGPLHAAFVAVGLAVETAGAVIKPIISLLNSPVGRGAAIGVLAMWAAFQGYQIARTALYAVMDGAAALGARITNTATETAVSFGLMQRDAGVTAAAIQADLAAIGAAAAEEAAAIDTAAADAAAAQLALARVSGTASEEQIAAYEATAAEAYASEAASVEAAAAAAAAADAAAADIVVAGESAAVGWSGLLGPIGLVAVGVLAVASAFHHSSSASKEAADAAKAYSDALSSGGKSDLVDSITKQLADNNLPAELQTINAALGRTAFSGKQFVTAISLGGKPLEALRARLEAVVKAGTSMGQAVGGHAASAIHTKLTPAAQAAAKALGLLNTQYDVLSKTAKKDLLDTKTFAGAAGAIQKTTTATKLGTETAKQYATMAGLVVDKNGIVAASQKQVDAAIAGVAHAYDTATASGSEFLSALSSFSKSAGTSADRAALIGATLKAANGDALSYAGAMNTAATANRGLVDSLRQQAKQVGKNGISVRQLLSRVVDLKTGTINYSKAAAGPLIQGLQGIQSAAMQAASATYQHARATEGGKRAADDAYKVYVSQTKGQFIDSAGRLTAQAKQLGLNHDEAKKLSDTYFGMPKDVKTQIEAEGANPILDVLNRIGQLLANVTGQQWNINVHTNYTSSGAPPKGLGGVGAAPTGGVHPGGFAEGGAIHGPGTATSDSIPILASNDEHMVSAAEVKGLGGHRAVEAIRAAGRAGRKVMGFASGGAITTGKSGGKTVWIYDGIRYASQRAAQNAQTRAQKKTNDGAAISTMLGNVGHTSSPPFQVADTGWHTIARQLRNAQIALDGAHLSAKSRRNLTAQLHRLTHLAFAQEHQLKVKIKGSDMAAVRAAIRGTVDDARTAFGTLLHDMRAAGATAKQLAGVQWESQQFIKEQRRYVAEQARAAKIADYSTSIKDTLSGGFDPTKAGSVTDLLAGFQGQTDQNNAYAGEVDKLRGEAKGDPKLLAFINQLEQSGQTATLQTLAGASKADLSQVSKAYGGYQMSLGAGADAATLSKFGVTSKQEQSKVDKLHKGLEQIAGAIGTMAGALSHEQATIHLANGTTLDAHITRRVDHRLAGLQSHLTYGRKRHR